MSEYKKFIASLNGTINGCRVALRGSGICSDSLGIVDGKYKTGGAVTGFDPLVFNAFVVTGYPSESSSVGQAINPFKKTDYSYDRVVRFEDGKEIVLHTECMFKADTLISEFELHGQSDIPALESIEPLVETWVPVTKNHIKGFFTMIWKTKDGAHLTAQAHSLYYVPHPHTTLDTIHHRWVKIQALGDALSFSRYQVSKLWKGDPFSPHQGLALGDCGQGQI